ncbi:MAG: AmmeMemoRadiSam system protein A [Campylobacterota bacterium]|nr:AmmeMemoRadiSam system protein A [Campylobacterota bacterium]
MNRKYLIDIANSAILEELQQKVLIDKRELLSRHPELRKKGAVFVTLELDKNLRGCIGSLTAHRTLLDDIVSNAKAAAFQDTRFRQLTQREFDYDGFTIEISLLSEPKRLHYRDADDLYKKIRPNIDGVVLQKDRYRGTYLPQVWEQLPRPDKFFASLCQKAGMRPNCLDFHPEIYTYKVEKIKE